MRSWGMEDIHAYGYIRVNGVTRANLAYHAIRGVNTAILNPMDCSTANVRNFDTYENELHTTALTEYISGLDNGTILLGVAIDEASVKLVPKAREVLMKIGVNASGLRFRHKLAFATVVGNPALAKFSIAPPGGRNLLLEYTICHWAENSSKYNELLRKLMKAVHKFI